MNEAGLAIVQGMVLGLTSGIAPGPMLTLVITETMRFGLKAGLKVAAVPLITDGPVIAVFWFFWSMAGIVETAAPYISLAGGLFLLFLAYETYQAAHGIGSGETEKGRTLQKSIATNLLNPAPYLFWGLVGVPLMKEPSAEQPLVPWFFMGSFFFFIILSKAVLAMIVSRFKRFQDHPAYRWLLRTMSLALVLFAIWFFNKARLGFL